MRFFSDNAAAVHPKVMEAIAAANRVDTAYDGDEWSQRLDGAFSDLFGTRGSRLLGAEGTAANCLALAALCPPYRGILCHKDAHIEVDEAGGPGFFTGGAKLMLLDGDGGEGQRRRRGRCVRPHPQGCSSGPAGRRSRSPTRPNMGSSTGPRKLRRSASSQRSAGSRCTWTARGSPTRRQTGESIADMTWRAGVDALSFGFVKNGGMNAEALILFSTELADEIAVRRKRAGHLLSKGRYPRRADCSRCSRTVCGWTMLVLPMRRRRRLPRPRRERLVYPVEANEVFVRVVRSGGAPRALKASISTTGARAKSVSSPAGTSRASTRSPCRCARCAVKFA